jgi:hypothetical protein
MLSVVVLIQDRQRDQGQDSSNDRHGSHRRRAKAAALAARTFQLGAGVKTAPTEKGGWSSAQLPQPDPPERIITSPTTLISLSRCAGSVCEQIHNGILDLLPWAQDRKGFLGVSLLAMPVKRQRRSITSTTQRLSEGRPDHWISCRNCPPRCIWRRSCRRYFATAIGSTEPREA